MTHPVPEGLPVWVQALIYVGTVAGSVVAAFLGWRRKGPGPADAQNTIVAGDIMDTRPMKDLAAAVDRLAAAEDRTTEAVDRVERAVNRLNDLMDRRLP